MNLKQLLYALPVETHFVITYGILSYVGHRSEQVEAILFDGATDTLKVKSVYPDQDEYGLFLRIEVI